MIMLPASVAKSIKNQDLIRTANKCPHLDLSKRSQRKAEQRKETTTVYLRPH